MNNIERLEQELCQSGYKKKGRSYFDSENNLSVQLNKSSVTLRSAKGTQLIYASPAKLSADDLERIIQTSIV